MGLGFLCCSKPEESEEGEQLLASAVISNDKMSYKVQLAVNIFSMQISSLVHQHAWEFAFFIVCTIKRITGVAGYALVQQNKKNPQSRAS